MPDRLWHERLSDILDAAGKIRRYVGSMSEGEFYGDSLTFDAVVRNIILIGDAATGIDTTIREQMPGIPWSQIVGMRNILTHEYFEVDPDVIWHVATLDLPSLVFHLEDFLEARGTA